MIEVGSHPDRLPWVGGSGTPSEGVLDGNIASPTISVDPAPIVPRSGSGSGSGLGLIPTGQAPVSPMDGGSDAFMSPCYADRPFACGSYFPSEIGSYADGSMVGSHDPMAQYRKMLRCDDESPLGVASLSDGEEDEERRRQEVEDIDAELLRRMEAITAQTSPSGVDMEVHETPLHASASCNSLGSGNNVAAPRVKTPLSSLLPLRTYIRSLALSPEKMLAFEQLKSKTKAISEHDLVRTLLCRHSLLERLQLAREYRTLCDRYGLGYLEVADLQGTVTSTSTVWGPDVTAKDDSLCVFYNPIGASEVAKDESESPRLLLCTLACLALLRPVEFTVNGVTLCCDCSGLSAFDMPEIVSLFLDIKTKVPVCLKKINQKKYPHIVQVNIINIYMVNCSKIVTYAWWACTRDCLKLRSAAVFVYVL